MIRKRGVKYFVVVFALVLGLFMHPVRGLAVQQSEELSNTEISENVETPINTDSENTIIDPTEKPEPEPTEPLLTEPTETDWLVTATPYANMVEVTPEPDAFDVNALMDAGMVTEDGAAIIAALDKLNLTLWALISTTIALGVIQLLAAYSQRWVK